MQSVLVEGTLTMGVFPQRCFVVPLSVTLGAFKNISTPSGVWLTLFIKPFNANNVEQHKQTGVAGLGENRCHGVKAR